MAASSSSSLTLTVTTASVAATAPTPTTTTATGEIKTEKEPHALNESGTSDAGIITNLDGETNEEEDVLATSLRSCANDPDFAVICAFLQKFSKDLGVEVASFKQLQEWLSNTDEVAPQLRDLHIKLLRKTRKTVHEKSWESSLSKFCFTYSAQDAWEVERFGYKKSSLKVKLRIFRELLESQFERNAKFRSKLVAHSADSLRSQPIGRDRLGHSYWFTQDSNCNLRIYQEHLDEEIWQVVATNREELVNLIARLRGNEVVLPSADIGVIDEDTSSSNSNAPVEKPPPPEEKDDSQEEEAKVPNIRIKLTSQNGKVTKSGVLVEDETPSAAEKSSNVEDESEHELEVLETKAKTKQESNTKKVKPLLISQAKISAASPTIQQTKKRPLDDSDKSSPNREELSTLKKPRPTLLDSKRAKKPSRYEKVKSEDDDDDEEEEDDDDDDDDDEEDEEDDGDDDGEEEESEEEDDENAGDDGEDDVEEEGEEEDIDSAAAEEDENEEKDIEEDDYDDDEDEVGESIEEAAIVVRGQGSGKDCDGGNPNWNVSYEEKSFLMQMLDNDPDNESEVNEAIEDDVLYVFGSGSGEDCLVGNTKNESETSSSSASEPKATFFFGEPGCLKLSPIKPPAKMESRSIFDTPQQLNFNLDDKNETAAVQEEAKKEKNEEEEEVMKVEIDNGKKENCAESLDVEETEIVETETKIQEDKVEGSHEIECHHEKEEHVSANEIMKATEDMVKVNGSNKSIKEDEMPVDEDLINVPVDKNDKEQQENCVEEDNKTHKEEKDVGELQNEEREEEEPNVMEVKEVTNIQDNELEVDEQKETEEESKVTEKEVADVKEIEIEEKEVKQTEFIEEEKCGDVAAVKEADVKKEEDVKGTNVKEDEIEDKKVKESDIMEADVKEIETVEENIKETEVKIDDTKEMEINEIKEENATETNVNMNAENEEIENHLIKDLSETVEEKVEEKSATQEEILENSSNCIHTAETREKVIEDLSKKENIELPSEQVDETQNDFENVNEKMEDDADQPEDPVTTNSVKDIQPEVLEAQLKEDIGEPRDDNKCTVETAVEINEPITSTDESIVQHENETKLVEKHIEPFEKVASSPVEAEKAEEQCDKTIDEPEKIEDKPPVTVEEVNDQSEIICNEPLPLEETSTDPESVDKPKEIAQPKEIINPIEENINMPEKINIQSEESACQPEEFIDPPEEISSQPEETVNQSEKFPSKVLENVNEPEAVDQGEESINLQEKIENPGNVLDCEEKIENEPVIEKLNDPEEVLKTDEVNILKENTNQSEENFTQSEDSFSQPEDFDSQSDGDLSKPEEDVTEPKKNLGQTEKNENHPKEIAEQPQSIVTETKKPLNQAKDEFEEIRNEHKESSIQIGEDAKHSVAFVPQHESYFKPDEKNDSIVAFVKENPSNPLNKVVDEPQVFENKSKESQVAPVETIIETFNKEESTVIPPKLPEVAHKVQENPLDYKPSPESSQTNILPSLLASGSGININNVNAAESKIESSVPPPSTTITPTLLNNANIPLPSKAASIPIVPIQPPITLHPSRKRRLADFAAPRHSTSESEIDFHGERVEEEKLLIDEELDDEVDVGGKRAKMRSKVAYTELRRKVEAKKVATEETSSSGEEDSRRRRKIISPKRKQVEMNADTTSKPIENAAQAIQMTRKETYVAPLLLPTRSPMLGKELNAVKHVTAGTVTGTVKQKPTLAEIIEKKLKKTPEKPQMQTQPQTQTQTQTQNQTQLISPPQTQPQVLPTNVEVEPTISTFSPPKKSPITKPLKKNLLTQLRHEESDEEAIPRKRTNSETVAIPTIVETTRPKSPISPKSPKEITESAVVVPVIKSAVTLRKTPERKTPDRQRKRRSSEEATKRSRTPEPADTEDVGVSEKLKKNNDFTVTDVKVEEITKQTPASLVKDVKIEETQVTVKKEPTPPPAPPVEPVQPVVGRRSGRRGGAAVVYTELPQPKRTRGGAKAAAAASAAASASASAIKKDEVEQETIKEEEKKIEESPTPPKETKANADTKKKPVPKPTEKAATKSPPKATPVTPKAIAKTKEKTTPDSTPTSKAAPANATTTTSTPKAADTPASTPGSGRGRGGRKKREVDTTNIIETTDAETPVRQSRRIAQQKIREEAERRKLEEIALRTMKEELKKKKKAQKEADPTVVEPSEQSSSDSEASEVETTKKKTKKKCPGKDGWSSGSEEQEEPEEEDEEPPHYETDPGSPLFKSDHEFSPESDLEDESQVVPMKRARTARKEDAEEGDDGGDEEACQNCGKSDHPEWILLCDSCDKGYHCSCLSPVLFYIPEGDWYCPPCQQEQLIVALERQLKEFDELVERKRLEEEEGRRLAEEAERAEKERLEMERERKKDKKKGKNKHRGSGSSEDDEDDDDEDGRDEDNARKSDNGSESEEDDKEVKMSKKFKHDNDGDKSSRRRGDGRSRRRAATRGARQRRRHQHDNSESGSCSRSGSSNSKGSSGSDSSSSSATDSDDEPIYKLRKRRQINVSYRLNEFDDLINSALKKEMDEVAGAGNLGRGKDITTIIEADKEEKARKKQLEENGENECKADVKAEDDKDEGKDKQKVETEKSKSKDDNDDDDDDDDDEPIKRKPKPKPLVKKKPRKLTTLDISSEEDDASDEDFKTSSFDDEDEDEDTSVSVSTNSDSSLEVYRRRNKHGKKKQRKAARRAARERRKDRKFIVDESDDEEEEALRPKTKKKRKDDSDYTESETADDDDELTDSENVDSEDLCDDTTSDDSDGAWRPSKRKKQRKSNTLIARKSPKLKKPQTKKPKRVEYSDDDISETEEEEEEEDDGILGSGKGSGKQPRSQPLKPSTTAKTNTPKSGAGKGKGKGKAPAPKKKKRPRSEDEDSFSDSGDSTRRTRGRRYAYLEDFDDDSSDGGIKPGVKRPDTPPEERQKFIQKQEEIKRMLAEKNAEGAKLAATPRLTPIKGAAGAEKEKRSPAKPGDSLSTVPLSVIRQAKVLDIDYLQRKGETVGELGNVDGADSEFDDADLPDFPEDMDEDAIVRMVEEDGVFDAATAARELPTADEVLRAAPTTGTTTKSKPKPEPEKPLTNPSLAALSQMPGATISTGLQEPMRKRLPMPTIHPPLLRHQFPPHGMSHMSLMQRHPGPPPTHLLQNALSAPLGQSSNRNFHGGLPNAAAAAVLQRMPSILGQAHALPPHLLPARQPLPPTSQPLHSAGPAAQESSAAGAAESESKPRGRRKKITPLRDPLQKQQAAAAVTAAAASAAVQPGAPEKGDGKVSVVTPTGTTKTIVSGGVSGGVIKSVAPSVIAPPPTTSTAAAAATALTIAQPPQLYKPGSTVPGVQPSVITRMPHLPPHVSATVVAAAAAAAAANVRPGAPQPGNVFSPGGDVARFYGPPQQVLPPGARPPPNNPSVVGVAQRHRVPPQMGGLPPPHSGMRPTYGPPPPLRGSGATQAPPLNHAQPPLSTAAAAAAAAIRASYAPGDQHAVSLSAIYGAPPPARHTAPHLNPYRPLIYGNPNFTHRTAPPVGANMRPGAPPGAPGGPNAAPGADYSAGARAYPPYGYYPPPPPLTTAHPGGVPLPAASTHSTGAPSSVIVAAPPAATSAPTSTVPPPQPPTSAHPANHAHARVPVAKSPSPITAAGSSVAGNNKSLIDSRKKLTTLETYAVSAIKSPLAIAGESSGSRSSPGMQPDGADDSSSAPAASSATASAGNAAASEGQPSEFSGLVSYFSSQHDDYNT